MKVLGIETSCDETSVAILEASASSVRVLHHETATQIPVHALYGGVVPEIAARLHVAETVALLDRALGKDKQADKFDAIAVTQGPGLATALRVGIEAARTLALVTKKPIIGVNHLEGHLASAWLIPENRKNWKFPILALLVSGGHSELVLMKDFCSYKILGRTRDDAAGEAFDKTAKLMGLGYPGGPIISKLAETGNPEAFKFPRPMIHDPSLDFSFSGLKTAVRQTWEKLPKSKQSQKKVQADLCASIQQAITDVLVAKTIRAAEKYKPTAICIVGGVSANKHLQQCMRSQIRTQLKGVKMLKPSKGFYTDNAAMIAAAGAWHLLKGEKHDWRKMGPKPELDL
ncbi:tRNA (adenosine(37)-N6)-threonylcarbamoyltransferase complex transferase subunit TsaD [Patescibacteria group bacterium]|nr:tRNA (adenosine(37)-N6)-threonylcarbamoyltransferase complex transferase subunit TsaD [Patescibacteria group bacterium]MBU2508785.1 tRNA (adenosine(37)-N6)-threonylcarbamoyltransferase complex transferase subunit TsaD [Patescibacteria group bacterium]